MSRTKTFLLAALGLCLFMAPATARYDPKLQKRPSASQRINFREACTTAQAQIDQDVNNVRARLLTGGDIWWDRNDGKYVVPKPLPGQPEVSAIFAAGIWMGGFDPGGNLKVACQTYGNNSGDSDFWPGPLSADDGTTDKFACDNWDRFFEVTGQEIREHLDRFRESEDGGEAYTADQVPAGVRGWPGRGNPYFYATHLFPLHDSDQGLAGFWDEDGDGRYDPLQGDFPIVDLHTCQDVPMMPDQMIFWIYNDEGGGAIHGETEGIPIRMEIQATAFAYATDNALNDMTFQQHKFINRAKEDIDSMYFALWMDADLGCYLDDLLGCDPSRDFAYAFNMDDVDGHPGVACNGVPTYGNTIPAIGIDIFRGPLDENHSELGMSSFMYFSNGDGPPGTTPPSSDTEFYRYMSGSWKDGTRLSYGGDGYAPGATTNLTNFAFPSAPNDPNGWSMCHPGPEFPTGLPPYDRRTVQSSGPTRLQPGAVNELLFGVVYAPNLDYPCPDLSRLFAADDLAQDFFDDCFVDWFGYIDAPDVDWIALDREIIGILSNKPPPASNNYLESFEEYGISMPEGVSDSTYNFEGYLVYQLAGPNVRPDEFDDPAKARLVFQTDVKNGIGSLYNWASVPGPGGPSAYERVFYPEVKVQGLDEGIRHTFRLTEDQFAVGDRRLINHRNYYYVALAYATNNYAQFDPLTGLGQTTTYIQGRNNIGPRGDGLPYTVTPRPIVDRTLNAAFGDSPAITRIDGVGVGGNFVDLSDETLLRILDGTFDGEIEYLPGRGPIDVQVFNPMDVVDGEYEITFVDENMANSELDNEVYWQLKSLTSNDAPVLSDQTIAQLNEQIFGQYGFSVAIGQTTDAGDCTSPMLGGIGAELVYDSLSPIQWFSAIYDGFSITGMPWLDNVFNFVTSASAVDSCDLEPLAHLGDGFFVPFRLCDYRDNFPGYYLSPAWRDDQADLAEEEGWRQRLNNVDLVFTPDTNLWSRCMVVETINPWFTSVALTENGVPVSSQGESKNFDLRAAPSVGKSDANGDGLPDPDGDDIGMGWFPGYAIDVETGRRLNVFFGENSAYRTETGYLGSYANGQPNGSDMMFNPSSQLLLDAVSPISPVHYYAGGQHFIYVTREAYDGCAYLRTRFHPVESDLKKINGLNKITWTAMPVLALGESLLPYSEGLIPNRLTVKLRVDNPYAVEVGTGGFNGYPTYRFKLEGMENDTLDGPGEEEALAMVNMVPNPYYAFSDHEDGRNSAVVKITNLPAECVVTIYSVDGKFIRRYNRHELPAAPNGSGISSTQISPALEWDLKNAAGLPISSGAYLIHVKAPGLGERTLKWFGISRTFDPSGF